MRRAAALAAALALFAVAGCGDDPKIAWRKAPTVFTPDGLPHDRIAVGEVKNRSGKTVQLAADDIRVVDSDGHALRSDARYAAGFAHDLYGFYAPGPKDMGRSERLRLGRNIPIAPGDSKPLTVAWRVPVGARPAARIELGPATLQLPGR